MAVAYHTWFPKHLLMEGEGASGSFLSCSLPLRPLTAWPPFCLSPSRLWTQGQRCPPVTFLSLTRGSSALHSHQRATSFFPEKTAAARPELPPVPLSLSKSPRRHRLPGVGGPLREGVSPLGLRGSSTSLTWGSCQSLIPSRTSMVSPSFECKPAADTHISESVKD